jgi:hypothetical protein
MTDDYRGVALAYSGIFFTGILLLFLSNKKISAGDTLT